MKQLFFCAILLCSLQACSTLSSTTYIDPQKSFVLGENEHSGYTASVKNVGNTDIEVVQLNDKGIATSLGILKNAEKQSYSVVKDATIKFENKGEEQGIIKIFAKGDTNLSMGYTE
ncbi:MAG: hypothetical protein ACPG5B_08220 [Chitinophagales bacterium]